MPPRADQQRCIGRQFTPLEQPRAQPFVAQGRRKDIVGDAHRVGDDIGHPAFDQAIRQALPRGHRCREHFVEAKQMFPEPSELLVDPLTRRNPAKPAIGIGRQGVSVHDQRARGRALPLADQPRAAPRRRCFDNVRLLGIERRMQRHLITEIIIFAVERKFGLVEKNDPRLGSALLDAVFVAGRDDHDLVPRRGPRDQFTVDIGLHAPTVRRVKSGDIDDLHGALFNRPERDKSTAIEHAHRRRRNTRAGHDPPDRNLGFERS